MRRQKSSPYTGVYFSQQKKRWMLRVQAAGIHRVCQSELEAAMLYNAIAVVLWPAARRNPTPLEAMGGSHYLIGTERVISLGEGLYTFVEQSQSVRNYWTAVNLGWFWRDGFVQRGLYRPETKEFSFETLHEYIFGGACFHRNGSTLDNRLFNLVAAGTIPLPPELSQDEQEAVELHRQHEEEPQVNQEGSSVILEPGNEETFGLLLEPDEE